MKVLVYEVKNLSDGFNSRLCMMEDKVSKFKDRKLNYLVEDQRDIF